MIIKDIFCHPKVSSNKISQARKREIAIGNFSIDKTNNAANRWQKKWAQAKDHKKIF